MDQEIFFDRSQNRLVYSGEKSSPDFWDKLWGEDDLRTLYKSTERGTFVTFITKKYLKPCASIKILEAGCGKGQHVFALHRMGYDVHGIDFAEHTIESIRWHHPELKVACQDIRNIRYPDDFFDAYWSLGVIEHFYDGYGAIISEARRVLRKDGLLLLTFPQLSPLRKIKALANAYSLFNPITFNPAHFYQFALDWKSVRAEIERHGFQLVSHGSYDGIKGLKDDIDYPPLKKTLQYINGSKNPFLRAINMACYFGFTPLCGHIALLVFKKR